MRALLASSTALAAMGISGWLVGAPRGIAGDDSVQSIVEQAPVGSDTLDLQESQAAASLIGQFRTSAASWLWLRTDLYLHNGVEMRPLTEDERNRGRKAESAAKDDGLHENESIVTVVPGEERDFRGLFGKLERATTAYKAMADHDHDDPVQALPLFRLMTWIDPKFVRGWTVGASVLAREDVDKAISYLEEGVKANPRSIPLLAELGAQLAGKRKEYGRALRYLDEAIVAGEKRVAKQTLEPESDDAEGMLSALRWAALCYRELAEGQGAHDNRDVPIPRDRQVDLQKMHAVARYGLSLFPEDPVLLRAAEEPPSVLTEKGRRRWFESRPEREETERHGTHGAEDHDH